MKPRAEINLHHGDCMDAMRGMEDNQYALAIVEKKTTLRLHG